MRWSQTLARRLPKQHACCQHMKVLVFHEAFTRWENLTSRLSVLTRLTSSTRMLELIIRIALTTRNHFLYSFAPFFSQFNFTKRQPLSEGCLGYFRWGLYIRVSMKSFLPIQINSTNQSHFSLKILSLLKLYWKSIWSLKKKINFSSFTLWFRCFINIKVWFLWLLEFLSPTGPSIDDFQLSQN